MNAPGESPVDESNWQFRALDVSGRALRSVSFAVLLFMFIGEVTIVGVSQYKIHDFYGRMNSAQMIGKTQQQIRAIYGAPTRSREDHLLANSHTIWFY